MRRINSDLEASELPDLDLASLSEDQPHGVAGGRYSVVSADRQGRPGMSALLSQPLIGVDEIRSRPCPIPAAPGVYGWWFDQIPAGVPTEGCIVRDGSTLLYVGISPKRPPMNGKPPSSQTVRSRVRYHCRGNAAGSTLRLTLGVLLSDQLAIQLRRVGSGGRRTFSTGEQALTAWIAEHARVSIVQHAEPWVLEEELIRELVLPLNLDQNSHRFRPTLSAMRSAARATAEALPVLPR